MRVVQDWFGLISRASLRFYKLLLHGCIPLLPCRTTKQSFILH